MSIQINEQREMNILAVMPNGIALIQDNAIALCETYRQAVRLSWRLRLNKGMLKQDLARALSTVTGGDVYASHVSDYLHKDDNPKRRDLKAEHVPAWNVVVGNYVVQQWLQRQSELNTLEEIQALRRA